MKRHPVYVVDAFTHEVFHGNPAAVCLLRSDLPDATLQAIASEMNLSETAFVTAPDGDLFAATTFGLRWFTPSVEVPLCGHATLASAKVLMDELGVDAAPIRFDTRSGPLFAHPRVGGIELDFPSNDPVPRPLPDGLDRALGSAPVEDAAAVVDRGLWVLRYSHHRDVHALTPDFTQIRRRFPGARVIVATAPGEGKYDFVSRCFAPNDGIDEDPVTGLAHTALGPYWARILGRSEFTAFQDSRRGGELELRIAPEGRIRMTGRSRLVLRGYLDVPEPGS
ncbi:MAG TPA: PhzF family phenazine biosynthesis protein [Thermoplasmata archaeon]|nr:PhzF family phenazine biosynthesis protein [Thermoplasmata archaeon]